MRSAAIDLLRALREPAGVPLLFERLELEQGRLQKDLVAALQDLTALQFPTTAAWRAWWQKEGASFRPVAKKDRDGERNEALDTFVYATAALHGLIRSLEIPEPAIGDQITYDGITYVVQSEPKADRERLVWTLDVRPA